MQFDNLLNQRKPQPGSLELLGQEGINLAERLENFATVFGFNTNSRISDRYFDHISFFSCSYFYNSVFKGELYGIIHEVVHYLNEPGFVSTDTGKVISYVYFNLNVFPVGYRRQKIFYCVKLAGKFKLFITQFQFSGFYFREIQDVIYQIQEVFSAL